MNDKKKNEFNGRMEALLQKYCQQLPEKYEAIENSWKKYQTDLSNLDYIDSFYRLIHTLKGTAATFGYIKQADSCFEIQNLLLKTKKEHTILSESEIKQIHKHLNELQINMNTPAQDVLV